MSAPTIPHIPSPIHPNIPNCGVSTANYFVTMYETPTPFRHQPSSSHTPCNLPHAYTSVLYVAWLYQCLFWIMSTPLRTPAPANSSPCPDRFTRTDQHGLQFSCLTPFPSPILSDIVLIACLPHLQSPCQYATLYPTTLEHLVQERFPTQWNTTWMQLPQRLLWFSDVDENINQLGRQI